MLKFKWVKPMEHGMSEFKILSENLLRNETESFGLNKIRLGQTFSLMKLILDP